MEDSLRRLGPGDPFQVDVKHGLSPIDLMGIKQK